MFIADYVYFLQTSVSRSTSKGLDFFRINVLPGKIIHQYLSNFSTNFHPVWKICGCAPDNQNHFQKTKINFWKTDSSPKFYPFSCVTKNLIYAAASSVLKIFSISSYFHSFGISETLTEILSYRGDSNILASLCLSHEFLKLCPILMHTDVVLVQNHVISVFSWQFVHRTDIYLSKLE